MRPWLLRFLPLAQTTSIESEGTIILLLNSLFSALMMLELKLAKEGLNISLFEGIEKANMPLVFRREAARAKNS